MVVLYNLEFYLLNFVYVRSFLTGGSYCRCVNINQCKLVRYPHLATLTGNVSKI